jgi:hypothetical protein
MAAIHAGHSSSKVALAVQARYVSTSLLAEGIEGTQLTMSVRAFATCEGRASMDACGVTRCIDQG